VSLAVPEGGAVLGDANALCPRLLPVTASRSGSDPLSCAPHPDPLPQEREEQAIPTCSTVLSDSCSHATASGSSTNAGRCRFRF